MKEGKKELFPRGEFFGSSERLGTFKNLCERSNGAQVGLLEANFCFQLKHVFSLKRFKISFLVFLLMLLLLIWSTNSVARFGDISPLWRNVKTLWPL